jgi:hypothetical protein
MWEFSKSFDKRVVPSLVRILWFLRGSMIVKNKPTEVPCLTKTGLKLPSGMGVGSRVADAIT